MERLARQPCRTALMIFDLYYNQFTLLAQLANAVGKIHARLRAGILLFNTLPDGLLSKPGVHTGLL
jgi:hypothetical protein